MRMPVIGLTMTRGQSRYGYPMLTLTEAYVNAVARAGTCPLLIPLGLPENVLGDILSRIDGLLLTGGGDVHPDQYSSQEHPLVNEVDTDRDRVEIYLIREAIDRKIPFLGICRGIQVLNIALGGTIYDDILDQHPGALRHNFFPEMPRQYLAHPVSIAPDSLLSKLLGRLQAPVNSLHHQGIKSLAPGIAACAIAPDGLIEAVELPDYPFGVAVQWHPEWLPEEAAMDNLFQGLAKAALE